MQMLDFYFDSSITKYTPPITVNMGTAAHSTLNP